MKVRCVQEVICNTQMIHNAAIQSAAQHYKHSDAWPKNKHRQAHLDKAYINSSEYELTQRNTPAAS